MSTLYTILSVTVYRYEYTVEEKNVEIWVSTSRCNMINCFFFVIAFNYKKKPVITHDILKSNHIYENIGNYVTDKLELSSTL